MRCLYEVFFGWCRHTGSLPIHGEASAKAKLYKDRFLLLYQRLSRDQHFAKPAFETETTEFGSCEVSRTILDAVSVLLVFSNPSSCRMWVC